MKTVREKELTVELSDTLTIILNVCGDLYCWDRIDQCRRWTAKCSNSVENNYFQSFGPIPGKEGLLYAWDRIGAGLLDVETGEITDWKFNPWTSDL